MELKDWLDRNEVELIITEYLFPARVSSLTAFAAGTARGKDLR
jgi:hypothetical protein